MKQENNESNILINRSSNITLNNTIIYTSYDENKINLNCNENNTDLKYINYSNKIGNDFKKINL